MPSRPPVLADPSPSRLVSGDWDDINAAVSRASSLLAVAPVRSKSVGDGAIGSVSRVELLSIDGQPASVTITPQGGWSPQTGPVPLLIESRFGEPNDPGRAAALTAEVAAALASLAGRRTAPAQKPLVDAASGPRDRPIPSSPD